MNPDKTFFGHPRGLATLFFTEMWERFSYYGMRALLLLFMVAAVEEGGMGLDEKTGGAVYGLYTMFVYLLALPGGWLADKYFGLRKSVFYGGCLITIGHFCLAFPFTETFFIGLLFIVMGTGLLKPNISSLVGELYSSTDQARRDSGFSISTWVLTLAPPLPQSLQATWVRISIGITVLLLLVLECCLVLSNISLPRRIWVQLG